MDFLFTNRYSKIIDFFLINSDKEFDVNEILKAVKISPKVLCDGLKELGNAGILLSENRANSIYYRLNKTSLLQFLHGIHQIYHLANIQFDFQSPDNQMDGFC